MLRLTILAAVAATGLAASAQAPPPGPILAYDLPLPFAGALLSLPARDAAEALRGVAIVVPDLAGPDGRAAPYVEALLRQGIAALEIATDPDDTAGPDIEATLVAARQALEHDRRFARLPVVLLGFGDGARVALAWAGAVPVAAVYPRCASVPALPPAEDTAGQAPLLLLHPAADATDRPGACARLVDGFGPGGFRHAYDQATPGWDIPPVGAVVGPTRHERDLGLRHLPLYRAAVAADAARRAAWFLDAAIEGAGPWAPPEDSF